MDDVAAGERHHVYRHPTPEEMADVEERRRDASRDRWMQVRMAAIREERIRRSQRCDPLRAQLNNWNDSRGQGVEHTPEQVQFQPAICARNLLHLDVDNPPLAIDNDGGADGGGFPHTHFDEPMDLG